MGNHKTRTGLVLVCLAALLVTLLIVVAGAGAAPRVATAAGAAPGAVADEGFGWIVQLRGAARSEGMTYEQLRSLAALHPASWTDDNKTPDDPSDDVVYSRRAALAPHRAHRRRDTGLVQRHSGGQGLRRPGDRARRVHGHLHEQPTRAQGRHHRGRPRQRTAAADGHDQGGDTGATADSPVVEAGLADQAVQRQPARQPETRRDRAHRRLRGRRHAAEHAVHIAVGLDPAAPRGAVGRRIGHAGPHAGHQVPGLLGRQQQDTRRPERRPHLHRGGALASARAGRRRRRGHLQPQPRRHGLPGDDHRLRRFHRRAHVDAGGLQERHRPGRSRRRRAARTDSLDHRQRRRHLLVEAGLAGQDLQRQSDGQAEARRRAAHRARQAGLSRLHHKTHPQRQVEAHDHLRQVPEAGWSGTAPRPATSTRR